MIKLSQKDFNNVFESFKNIQFEMNYNRNGQLQLPYSTCEFYNYWYCFKLTEEQMNQIIDYCLQDENNEYEVVRLCSLFSEQKLLKKTIPHKSYEYFLKKFSALNTDRYQHIYVQVIYMPAFTYDEPKDIDPTGELFKISLKYLNDLKISDSEVLRRFNSALMDQDESYRGYNNIMAFNDFVKELANYIPINEDDFKLEDDLEKYLWKKE